MGKILGKWGVDKALEGGMEEERGKEKQVSLISADSIVKFCYNFFFPN